MYVDTDYILNVCSCYTIKVSYEKIKTPSTPQSIEIDRVPYRVLDLFKRTCC